MSDVKVQSKSEWLFNNAARIMYEKYITNAIDYVNTKITAAQEIFMHNLELNIIIPGPGADDFRRACVCKWAVSMHKNIQEHQGYHSLNIWTFRPFWLNDSKLSEAIKIELRSKPELCKYEEKPKFMIGQTVIFTATCYLEYYQDKEEESRTRRVAGGSTGNIVRIIPCSTGWCYGVQLQTEHHLGLDLGLENKPIMACTEDVLTANNWTSSLHAYREKYFPQPEQRLMHMRQTETTTDDIKRKMADDFEIMYMKTEEKKCVCEITRLMREGCKCGHLEEKNENN